MVLILSVYQSVLSSLISLRDKDGDGKLNREELKQWIMPENYDHAKAEAAHLIYESDTDSVSGVLTHSCSKLSCRASFGDKSTK